MTTMRTTNGLTVPVGYGGGGRVQLKGASRPVAKTQRAAPRGRTFPAGQVTEGTRLRGQRTHDVYEVLAVTDSGNGSVTLHVMNQRTSDVRQWVRKTDFRVELA